MLVVSLLVTHLLFPPKTQTNVLTATTGYLFMGASICRFRLLCFHKMQTVLVAKVNEVALNMHYFCIVAGNFLVTDVKM